MTETLTKKRLLGKKSIRWILLTVLSVLIAVGGMLGLREYWEHEGLEALQREKLQMLWNRRGEYDERSIVLSDASEGKAKELAEKLGADVRITADGGFAVLTLPEDVTILDVYSSEEYLKDLSYMSADFQVRISDVVTEEKMRLAQPSAVTPSDPYYSYQTYLDYLHLDTVWNTTKGKNITVAVIDTGVDTDHPAFSGRISEYSYNATEDLVVKDSTEGWSLIEDEQGHGTSVAGVIAAPMDSEGITGVSPEVTLLVIKVACNENGVFERVSDLVFGLYYAIEQDVDVVNMSFGGYDCREDGESFYENALQLAYDSNVICVAAAGNEATTALSYPAADAYSIGVGALANDAWTLASYSNYGDNVDLVAPGSVYTTKLGGGYGNAQGTSFASPLTAGSIALLLTQEKYATVDDVTELLYASCADLGNLGRDWEYGFGALDVSALILEDRGTVTYYMMTDELENEEGVFIRTHTLQQLPEPERLYSVFDGWYYDPQYTQEYNYYEDPFVSDLTLYARWANEEDGIPFTYITLSDGTVEIRSYTGHRKYITVPEKIEGKMVSSIGEFAFSGQTRLREVTLPETLTSIGRYAFEDCSNLTTIRIPRGVTTIGEYAFYRNVRLSTVAFESSSELCSVGSFAFAYCSSLSKIEIPASVTELNGSALMGTIRLSSVNVQKANTEFRSEGGVLFNRTMSTLVAYPAGITGDYTVPDTVRSIGSYAFAYARSKHVNLGESSQIQNSAFVNASLTSLTIPDSVIALGEYAFENNVYLKQVTIGKGITTIPSGAFARCSALSELHIPSGIRSIEKQAFYQNGVLSELTFSEDAELTLIGANAFAACDLRTLTFPKSLMLIGESAFADNFALSEISFEQGSVLQTIGESAFAYAGDVQSVVFPETLMTIGDYAFLASGLSTVELPASLRTLGAGAFGFSDSLSALTVADGNAVYQSVDGVVYTLDGSVLVAYPTGKDIANYTVPHSVLRVGDGAFYGARRLNVVVLPNGVETIGKNAFFGCYNMTSYSLPDTLTEIEEGAFARNYELEEIAIPDGVTQIARFAFNSNKKLKQVRFNATAQLPRIGYAAFAYTGLNSFTVPASVSSIAQEAFLGCSALKTITFAANSKLDSISAYMFAGCESLETVRFEKGSALTVIQAHGFDGLSKLTSIDFGDAALTQIDPFAFRFCESLTELRIPDGVTYVGRYAFYSCGALTEIQMPADVEYIGEFAFLGTKNLNVYFVAEELPVYLAEDWDYGVEGYYLGVTDVEQSGDWRYSKLSDGTIAIIAYSGTETSIDLTDLNLGGSIVTIGGGAFAHSRVNSIVLPDSLTTIQAQAFYGSDLETVTIPSAVQFIGKQAFADTPLTILTFAEGASIRVIEQSAFENTKRLGSVSLPASVERMGRAVFKNSGIEAVSFANEIRISEIPQEAFAYTKLTAVRIPDSVTVIQPHAFRNTSELGSVRFGTAKDMMIMSNAFYQSGIQNLTIPANVTYIGEYAFVGLSRLTAFEVEADHAYYKAEDGLLLSADGRKLIAVPAGRTGSLTVPVSVEEIGFGAFEDSALSKVLFAPNANLLSLGYRSFYSMENLTEITVPISVISMDYYAFAECENLTKVVFEEGSALTGVYEGAFYGNRKLANVQLPDSVVEISDFAFYGCTSLTELPVSENASLKGISDYAMAYTGITEMVLPDSVIDVGSYAFRGSKLRSATVSDSNREHLLIGIGAFADCNELTELTVPFIGESFEDTQITWFGYIFGAGNERANAAYVPESLKRVTVTEGITTLGYGAFHNLAQLEEIHLPDSIVMLDQYALEGTSALVELTGEIHFTTEVLYATYFGTGLTGHLNIAEGITRIDINAFYDCAQLKGVTIPEGVTSLGADSFAYCTSLVKVDLPESLKEITGFNHCTSLRSIEIPEGVTKLGFYECTSLESLNIPDSVVEITTLSGAAIKSIKIPAGVKKLGSFSNCTNLVKIEIPEGVTEIGDFTECSALTKIKIPDGVQSVGNFIWCRNLVEIELPDSVTTLGAFWDCSSLRSIKLPSGLTKIGSSMFLGCSRLMIVELPAGVIEIEDSAFRGCNALMRIDLPNGLTKIGKNAFYYCNGLFEITLPQSLTTIDSAAFSYCDRLHTVYNNSETITLTLGGSDFGGVAQYARLLVDKDGNRTYKNASDGWEYVDTADGFRFIKINGTYTLVEYTGDQATVTLPLNFNGEAYTISKMRGVQNVIIPEGITSISSQAFEGCATLQSVTLPTTLKTIGYSAFKGCIGLTSITFPDGLEIIESDSFLGCTGLTSVTIPNSVKWLSSFYGCTGLREVTLSSSLTHVSGFYGCTNLQRVVIPSGVTSISSRAFDSCVSLTEVVIPDTVTQIGQEAFAGCDALTSLKLSDNLTLIEEKAFIGCVGLSDIRFPSSLNSIGKEAFAGCTALTVVTLPANLTSIGAGAFQNSGLKSCTVDPANTTYVSVGGVIYNKEKTAIVYVPDAMTSICIPKTVQDLTSVFANHKNLKVVTFEEGSVLTSIGTSAFSGCTALETAVLPSGITSIGNRAFLGCASLRELALPSGVSKIGEAAFYQCTSLTEIALPSAVTEISSQAFSGCTALRSITMMGVQTIGTSAFESCTALSEVVLPNTLSVLKNNAFGRCKSLTAIVLPNSLTTIGTDVLNGCSALSSVTFPNNITEIPAGMFEGCTSLWRIVIPESVTSIGDAAFRGCTNLAEIVFGQTGKLKIIGYGAFSNCQSLTDVTIPEGVTSIGSDAFWHCLKLMSVTIPSTVTVIGAPPTSFVTSNQNNTTFKDCNALSIVRNNSELSLTLGSKDCGYLAYYASVLVDRNGTRYYKDGVETDLTIVETADGFRFRFKDGKYTLIAYIGDQDTVTLPAAINGNSYTISSMRGVKHVIFPDAMTELNSGAFLDCVSLLSVTFGPNSQLQNIQGSAFKGCVNLSQITLPDGITMLSTSAFENTAYWNTPSNWEHGVLYIGSYLIRVAEDVEYFDMKKDAVVAYGAYDKCYHLKKVSIGGNNAGVFYSLSNLETLVITEMPTDSLKWYFLGTSWPLTLKTIILTEGVEMRLDAFKDITGVTIYVSANEKDLRWDANYPGWNNGNRVVYGDQWIEAKFYDENGALIADEIFLTTQVIRHPYMEKESSAKFSYVHEGWDVDGDGIADTIPATSTSDLTAKAIFREVLRTYAVTFYDKDGTTVLYRQILPYGSVIELPDAPTKTGYTFLAWDGYTAGMTVTGETSVYSLWEHNGAGHVYASAVPVAPTCIEQGYQKHVCTICGEWYGTDFVNAKGHSYTKTTVSPTCTEQGYDQWTCTCNDFYRDNFVDALDHDWGDWINDSAASCTENGLRHRACGRCSESEDDVVEATGHSYTATTILDASCTEHGKIQYVCAQCGDEIFETTELIAHDYQKKKADKWWLEWLIEYILNVFFGYEGNDAYYFECVNCKHIRTTAEEMMMSSGSAVRDVCEHSLGDWTVVNPATCENEGVEGRVCSLCLQTIEARTFDALGHDHSVITTESPTCIEQGYTKHKCLRCDDYFLTDLVEANGHTESEWIEDAAPTCEGKGSHHKECTVCHMTLTIEAIVATGHTTTVDPAVSASCTVTGLTQGSHCSVCDKVLVEQTVVDRLAHSESAWVSDQAPTCESIGYRHTACTVCHVTMKTESIAATGHSYEKTVLDATCTEHGTTEYRCATCGHRYTDSFTDALGHSFANEEAVACDRCAYTRTVEKKPLSAGIVAGISIVATAAISIGGCCLMMGSKKKKKG